MPTRINVPIGGDRFAKEKFWENKENCERGGRENCNAGCFEAWEDARAESARIAWVPYMFNPSLGPLLECSDKVQTLIMWGKEDHIAPVSAAEVYHKSIAGSELVILDGCGHRPEVEQADAFVAKLRGFLA